MIGKRTLHHAALGAFAVASFVAIYFLSVPFPLGCWEPPSPAPAAALVA